jgi:hypothetical protein
VQLYTGNHLKHAAVCLETQHYPDSVNKPGFPSTILRPGQKFSSTTVFAFSVKLFLDFRDPEFRHLGIDLGCKLNEARAVIQALHFPGQINRVNRYAMSAGSGTGTKSHKAKRLGGCGVNHLQGIDPELVADDSDFIDQSDIDLAKCVSRSLVISATVGELTGITLSTIC